MAEVSVRTSQHAGGSDVSQKGTAAFDVRSWQGLTKLLKAGKDSGMEPTAYAEFRDLVLSYAQSGGTDKELEAKIATLTTTFNIKTNETASPAPSRTLAVEEGQRTPREGVTTRSFGMVRPRPQFGVKDIAAAKDKNSVPDNLPTAIKVKSSEVTEEKTEAPKVNEEKKVREVPPPPPQPQKGIPPTKEKTAEVPPPAPRTESQSVAPRSVEEYKARILEIKHTVNAQVGNPVALVDAGNPVGRDYMRALLGAMKAVNGGAPGTLVSSMETLEDLFKTIMALPEKSTVPADSASVPTKATPLPVTQEKEAEVPKENVPTPEKAVEPKKSEAVADIPKENRAVSATPPPDVQKIPSVVDAPQVAQPVASVPVTPPPHPEPPKIVTEAPAASTPAVAAPAKKKEDLQIGQHNEVPSGATDDLESAEITQGLNQLLSEWSLFQSSGIFGTGSSGSEHPLYRKLAPLPMSIITSGSWDGAEKETVFSIRDYVAGWLHEQGVAYLQDESFEHYLRRVVKRIIKRQTK